MRCREGLGGACLTGAVVCEKLGVNGMTAAVSIFDVVPKANTRFAKLPAEIDFFTAIECREIDKPGLYVF